MNEPALRTLSIAELSALKPAQLKTVYNKIMRGAQPYNLAIVGDISKADAKALVLANIATLEKNTLSATARKEPAPKKEVKIEYTGNGRRNSGVSMQWIIPRQPAQTDDYDHLPILTAWLQELLSKEIREKQSLVYSIRASSAGSSKDTPVWRLKINLECDADKRQQVIAAVKTALTQFSETTLSTEKVQSLIKTARDERRQRYSKATARATWLARNDEFTTTGEPHTLDIDKRFQHIDPGQLKQLLAEFLRKDSVYVEVVSLP